MISKKLNNFLKWVDEKTTFFEDKNITISQIVAEYLLIHKSNVIKIDKDKCAHLFVENKNVMRCNKCKETIGGWLAKEVKLKP